MFAAASALFTTDSDSFSVWIAVFNFLDFNFPLCFAGELVDTVDSVDSSDSYLKN